MQDYLLTVSKFCHRTWNMKDGHQAFKKKFPKG